MEIGLLGRPGEAGLDDSTATNRESAPLGGILPTGATAVKPTHGLVAVSRLWLQDRASIIPWL
ncbi:MAG TPA: hypothetical protein VHS28_02175, partial [Chloroflexota bacterium]|nr:hypothetical protein [Chloroflexota bacterium]